MLYLGRTGLCSEHGQDAGATADVEDHLVLEQVLVMPHGVPEVNGKVGLARRANPLTPFEAYCNERRNR